MDVLTNEEGELVSILHDGGHPHSSAPVVIKMTIFVCQSLQLAGSQLNLIFNYIVACWRHRSISDRLTHEIEIVAGGGGKKRREREKRRKANEKFSCHDNSRSSSKCAQILCSIQFLVRLLRDIYRRNIHLPFRQSYCVIDNGSRLWILETSSAAT